MPEMSNFAVGILVIIGALFLLVLVAYSIRQLIISTRKQMCTMDRKEVRRIARDETKSEMNSKFRELKKKENQLKQAADVYKETIANTHA